MEIIDPKEVGVSSERLQRVSQLTRSYVDSGRLAGTVTLLARRGRVFHFEHCGLAEIQSGRPMDPDTIFRINSMTKPITSVAVMMLYEEGNFRLDDPVSKFIPELDGIKVRVGRDQTGPKLVDQQSPITIRQLLTHTAGLSYGFFPNSPVDEMYRQVSLLSPDSTLKELIGKLGQLPLAHQPGTEWRYSVATDVLGYLVEVVSGTSFRSISTGEDIRASGDGGYRLSMSPRTSSTGLLQCTAPESLVEFRSLKTSTWTSSNVPGPCCPGAVALLVRHLTTSASAR